jgi:hypothetical protein
MHDLHAGRASRQRQQCEESFCRADVHHPPTFYRWAPIARRVSRESFLQFNPEVMVTPGVHQWRVPSSAEDLPRRGSSNGDIVIPAPIESHRHQSQIAKVTRSTTHPNDS